MGALRALLRRQNGSSQKGAAVLVCGTKPTMEARGHGERLGLPLINTDDPDLRGKPKARAYRGFARMSADLNAEFPAVKRRRGGKAGSSDVPCRKLPQPRVGFPA